VSRWSKSGTAGLRNAKNASGPVGEGWIAASLPGRVVQDHPAARRRGMMPIRSATSTAGPLTSTGLPLDRIRRACSTTVGRNPCRASQYASVDPPMPAPEISTVRSFMTLSVLSGSMACMTNSEI
jgi:hypothetical protein